MTLDLKRMMEAEAHGVAFICRMCANWYKGEDLGLKDIDGDSVCTEVGRCKSPIGGGGFEHYKGPLSLGSNMLGYCYICGKTGPEKALQASEDGARKVGCCNACYEREIRRLHSVSKNENTRILFTRKESQEKFEVKQ